jgi:hypothetical protein
MTSFSTLPCKRLLRNPKNGPASGGSGRLGLHSHDLTTKILGRLVQARILRADDKRFLWVFSRRAYPQKSGREEREAKARLVSVIFNDDVPDSRDTLLLGLADSTGVLKAILSPEDMRKASTRIAQVIALEEINRSLGDAAARWRAALRFGSPFRQDALRPGSAL